MRSYKVSRPFVVMTVGSLVATLFITLGLTFSNPSLANAKGRMFYLTKDTFDGSQALTACDSKYHFAALWEILDPSNRTYDTTLGATQDDSGFGPPSNLPGWIRTGNVSAGGEGAKTGQANCDAWTSGDNGEKGTTAALTEDWTSHTEVGVGKGKISMIHPWVGDTDNCDMTHPVWCASNK